MAATAERPTTEKARLRQRIRETKRELTQLERDLERLSQAPKERREFDPHAQAGPANVELMRGVFKEGRVLTAAEATRRAGSKPGHQVWSIRALVAEGQIEETGVKVGLSKQYRWVGRRRRKTRLGPGE